MKKVLALCLCLAGFGVGAFAQSYEEGSKYPANSSLITNAEESSVRPYYVRLDAEAAYSAFTVQGSNGDQDLTGFQGVYNIGLGKNFDRARLELAYQKRGVVSDAIFLFADTTAFIDNDAILLNGFYDFVKAGFFSMYVGAGAGVNKWSSEITSFGQKHEDDGYSFIGGAYLGLSFAIYVFNLDLGMDYYYMSKLKMNTFGVKAGLRINF